MNRIVTTLKALLFFIGKIFFWDIVYQPMFNGFPFYAQKLMVYFLLIPFENLCGKGWVWGGLYSRRSPL